MDPNLNHFFVRNIDPHLIINLTLMIREEKDSNLNHIEILNELASTDLKKYFIF
jgi:hypothetical protein